MRRLRVTALAVVLAAASLSLTACDTGPECLDYETHMATTTTVVNGKVRTGTGMVSYCAEYAPE